jgi:hypothetical protein
MRDGAFGAWRYRLYLRLFVLLENSWRSWSQLNAFSLADLLALSYDAGFQCPRSRPDSMNCSILAAVAFLMAVPTTGRSQVTYRCGNTYSQTPCAVDAKPSPITGTAAPDAAPGPTGAQVCRSSAVDALRLVDPEAARIRSVVKAGAQAIEYAGKPTVAHRYDMIINAKNLNGAYAGDRLFACFLSEDERRFLKVQALGTPP